MTDPNNPEKAVTGPVRCKFCLKRPEVLIEGCGIYSHCRVSCQECGAIVDVRVPCDFWASDKAKPEAYAVWNRLNGGRHD